MDVMKQQKIYGLYFFVIILSFVITSLSIYYYPVFSSDTLYYLVTAQTYLQQGFHAAEAIYPWPWYSILIAYAAKILHLSLLHTAYLLNYIFFAGISILFISLVRSFTTDWLVLLAAAFFILTFRPLTKYSHFILRDNPYWFFMMLSIYCFVRYMKQPGWWLALGWSLTTFFAGLMRMEGWFFLLLAPWLVFLVSEERLLKRLGHFLQLNCLMIIGGLVLLSYFFLFGSHQLVYLGKFYNFLVALPTGGVFSFNTAHIKTNQLASSILPVVSAGYASLFLLAGLIAVNIWLFFSALSLVHLINLFYCNKCGVIIRSKAGLALIGYIAINCLILILFSLQTFNFVPRYFQLIALLVLVFSVFGFVHLYQSWQNKRTKYNKIMFPLVIFLLLIMTVGSLIRTGPNKAFVYQAGNWLQQHASASDKLYTNSGQIAWFSKLTNTVGWQCGYIGVVNDSTCFIPANLNTKPWSGNRFVVIVIDQKQTPTLASELNSSLGTQPIKTFCERTKCAVIYDLQNTH